MCSVSFVPRATGYDLAMNRDEARSRPPAHPPREVQDGLRRLLFPYESGGGTWIGLNDLGHTFALINWYAQPLRVLQNPLSRGWIVRGILSSGTAMEAQHRLENEALDRVQPFRLLSFWNNLSQVREWRWNGSTLQSQAWPWERRHWFSSGHDEPGAQQTRQAVADAETDLGTIEHLRALHAAHAPERGPYSICMHRAEAVTVSYTEVRVRTNEYAIYYLNQAPCEACPGHGVESILKPTEIP